MRRYVEREMPEGTLSVDGHAVRFCLVGDCGGDIHMVELPLREDNEMIMLLKFDGYWDAAYRIHELILALEEITQNETACEQVKAIALRALDGEREE